MFSWNENRKEVIFLSEKEKETLREELTAIRKVAKKQLIEIKWSRITKDALVYIGGRSKKGDHEEQLIFKISGSNAEILKHICNIRSGEVITLEKAIELT